MKHSFIIKKLDSCGRLTLPKEIREMMKLGDSDEIRLYFEEKRLIIERVEPIDTDLFENSVVSEPLYDYRGKKIARSSIIELAGIAGLISE